MICAILSNMLEPLRACKKKQGELDLYSKLKEKYSDVISEQPVMTYEEDGKVHVRWTDFYLPKENVLIEYLPIDEKDKGKIKWNFHPTPEEKKEIFEKNKIENIVYLYKSDLEEDKWNEKLEEKVGVKEGVVEEESKSFMGYVAGAIGAFFSIAASYIWFLAL